MKKKRYIYCLEGNWNTNPRSKQSVRPILELLYHSAGIKYIYRKCTTHGTNFLNTYGNTFKRYRNYTVLYIAFHGRPNGICIGHDFITLAEIAEALAGHLNGRIVHFGSCSTMRTKRTHIDGFLNRTGAEQISGYRKIVDFVEASAWEMTWFIK